MDPSEISGCAQQFKATLEAAKGDVSQRDFDWYPYGSLDNFHLLDLLLEGPDRTVFEEVRGQPVADIGTADGETAFFLESRGHEVDVIDNGPTNFNGCRGVRALAAQFGSQVRIHETDLDAQFSLPRERYGLTLWDPLPPEESLLRPGEAGAPHRDPAPEHPHRTIQPTCGRTPRRGERGAL